ncbi:hypothetical protein D3C86_1695010 [compost metagenome]
MGEGEGERVGRVVGPGDALEPEHVPDHLLDFGLLGAAVPRDGQLDLHGGVLGDAAAGLLAGEQDHPAGLGHADDGGDVAEGEELLDDHHARPVRGDQLRDVVVDDAQALGHGQLAAGGDDAACDQGTAVVVVHVDDAVAHGGGPRVDS